MNISKIISITAAAFSIIGSVAAANAQSIAAPQSGAMLLAQATQPKVPDQNAPTTAATRSDAARASLPGERELRGRA